MEQTMIPIPGTLQRITRFYVNGFQRMTVGKTLWKVIFIKLIIMFGVLKLFFFPDFLATKFSTDEQRADYVLNELSLSAAVHNSMEGGELE